MKWTFKYDFCARVTTYPQGAPNVSKEIDLDDHHLLLRPLTDALNLCEVFPEAHLNNHELDNLEELIEYLDLNFNWSVMAATHFAHPNPAIDKFSGTDPDQDAKTFIQPIERKINLAFADAPLDAFELANYTVRKKALFYSLLRVPAAEWYGNNITNATTWENVQTNFIIELSD